MKRLEETLGETHMIPMHCMILLHTRACLEDGNRFTVRKSEASSASLNGNEV